MPLSDFPRHPLTFGPSPAHPLSRLTALNAYGRLCTTTERVAE